MAKMTYEQQGQIRETIKGFLDANSAASLREIANHVEEETGIGLSLSTILRLLGEMGYIQRPAIWEKRRGP